MALSYAQSLDSIGSGHVLSGAKAHQRRAGACEIFRATPTSVRNEVEDGMPLGAVAKQRGLKGTLPIREKPAQCAGFDAEREGT